MHLLSRHGHGQGRQLAGHSGLEAGEVDEQVQEALGRDGLQQVLVDPRPCTRRLRV